MSVDLFDISVYSLLKIQAITFVIQTHLYSEGKPFLTEYFILNFLCFQIDFFTQILIFKFSFMVAVYFDQVIEKQKQNITRGVKQKKNHSKYI